jgi:predicted transcriptional regulator
VKALAKKPNGMTRNEILQTCNLSSGGTFSRLMDELIQSGFISEYLPFGKINKDGIFKLNDEFSLFYNVFF